MSAHAYPGLFRDPRQRRLWPALVCSVALHLLLFWSFSRLHIRSESALPLPSYTLELSGGLGTGPEPKRAEAPEPWNRAPAAPRAEPAEEGRPPPEEPKKVETKGPEKVIPKPEPPSARPAAKTSEKPVAPPAAKPAVADAKPEKGAKPLPLNPAKESKPPEKAAETAPNPPPQKPAHDGDGEKQVAERIAKLQEKRAEQAVSDRIDRMRRNRTQGDEESVSAKIASLRTRVGSLQERPVGAAREGTGGGAAGPVGPGGGRAGAGNILQDVRLRTYYESLWEAIRRNWSIPPSLEGKGYETVLAIVYNRQGRLLQVTIEKSSGSRLYDQQAQRAVEVTSAKGELAIPRDLPEPQDVGIRFRKDD